MCAPRAFDLSGGDLMRQALFDLVCRYGVPRSAWFDNGREVHRLEPDHLVVFGAVDAGTPDAVH